MAGQKGTSENNELLEARWRACGAALLGKIGPAILQTHSDGAPFGWMVANERPKMVKAIVTFEGTGTPLLASRQGGRGGANAPAPATLPNLAGIPVAYFAAENSGRVQGPAIVDALNRSGAHAELILFKDRGAERPNGHFAMLEKNRKTGIRPYAGLGDVTAG